MRASMIAELSTPLLAFGVVVVASLTATPAVLSLMAPLWFLPAVVADRSARPLDEREVALRERGERVALLALLLVVCSLPLIGGSHADAGIAVLRQEWADAGLLLVAVFVIRALVFAAGALAPARAAQYAGALAGSMAIAWGVGLALLRPSGAVVYLAAAGLAALPHLMAVPSRRAAGALWIAGAGAVAVHAIGTGLVPIELVVVGALFVLPWSTAGWWSLRAAAS